MDSYIAQRLKTVFDNDHGFDDSDASIRILFHSLNDPKINYTYGQSLDIGEYCDLLKTIINRRVIDSKSDKYRKPSCAKKWFSDLFTIKIWEIVPSNFFIVKILPLLCHDELYSTIETVHSQFLSRAISRICIKKLTERMYFSVKEILCIQRSFLFFAGREDIYMTFPLSFLLRLYRERKN